METKLRSHTLTETERAAAIQKKLLAAQKKATGYKNLQTAFRNKQRLVDAQVVDLQEQLSHFAIKCILLDSTSDNAFWQVEQMILFAQSDEIPFSQIISVCSLKEMKAGIENINEACQKYDGINKKVLSLLREDNDYIALKIKDDARIRAMSEKYWQASK